MNLLTGPYVQLVFCLILAAIPVGVWGYVFYRKNPENKYLSMVTFLCGGLSVFPILLYKYSWKFFPWMNAFTFAEKFGGYQLNFGNLLIVPLSVLITFMIVGIIEEWAKNFVVRVVDGGRIKSIDDAVSFCIIAALGFAFVENVLYFYDIWLAHGANNLVLPFVFRSLFSTFAHVMFSGIFGYFYGVAYFSSPDYVEQVQKRRRKSLRLLHRAFRFRTSALFHEEKILEGLLVAAGLHAIFNVALELDLAFVLVPFLSLGYLTLNHLLKKRRSGRVFAEVEGEEIVRD